MKKKYVIIFEIVLAITLWFIKPELYSSAVFYPFLISAVLFVAFAKD